MRVDPVDVRRVAEFADVDPRQHLTDDLGGQRDVHRQQDAEPERESKGDWKDVGPPQFALQLGEPEGMRQPPTAAQVELALPERRCTRWE